MKQGNPVYGVSDANFGKGAPEYYGRKVFKILFDSTEARIKLGGAIESLNSKFPDGIPPEVAEKFKEATKDIINNPTFVAVDSDGEQRFMVSFKCGGKLEEFIGSL